MALANAKSLADDTSSEPLTRRAGGSPALRRLRRNRAAIAGIAVFGLIVVMALTAPWIAPYNPNELSPGDSLKPPSAEHWLGTDSFGRDVLTRLIYGSCTALLVGFGASMLGASIGALLGVGSAYFGGRIDLYLQRFMDVLLSFPLIILALALVAILGNSIPNLIIAIMIPMIPRCALVIRSSALSIREMPYVDAARAAGFASAEILRRAFQRRVGVSPAAYRTRFRIAD